MARKCPEARFLWVGDGELKDEFVEALCKTGAYEVQEDGSLLLTGNGYTVTVRADYTACCFDYTAVQADGRPIYSFRYPYDGAEGGAA